MNRGRPSTYTPEVAEDICARIASGESLRAAAAANNIPPSTVVHWNLDNVNGFSAQYTRARMMQAEGLADELFAIADDGSNDWQEGQFGPMFNKEAAARSRLRVDTRKWYLSKVLPKVYGERVALEHSGEVTLLSQRLANARKRAETKES